MPSNGIHRSIICHRHSRHPPRTEGKIDRLGQQLTRIGRTASADPRIRPTTTPECIRPSKSPVVRRFTKSGYPVWIYIGVRCGRTLSSPHSIASGYSHENCSHRSRCYPLDVSCSSHLDVPGIRPTAAFEHFLKVLANLPSFFYDIAVIWRANG